jgi:hypothetical protein
MQIAEDHKELFFLISLKNYKNKLNKLNSFTNKT